MITAKQIILYTTLTLSTQQQQNTLVTAASLQNVQRQTKVFIDPNVTQYNPPIDLSSYGYNFVHNSSDTSLLEWISWPPPNEGGIDTEGNGKVVTSSNVNSIDDCASICQGLNAPSGSYQPNQSYCYCYFFNPTNLITNSNGDIVPETEVLCREPCLEYKYIDFSIDINFENLDYCEKSSCNWYYSIIGEACLDPIFNPGGTCAIRLAELENERNLGSDNPTGSPSGSVCSALYAVCVKVYEHMMCSILLTYYLPLSLANTQ